MEKELWAVIPNFEDYRVSNLGRIYNERLNMNMRPSCSNFGHLKITLVSSIDGLRYTRSVAFLVATLFLEPPRDSRNDHVVLLDGNLANVSVDNMMWRPRHFAWRYAKQFKSPIPAFYQNLIVCDVTTGVVYQSIMDAGMTLGLIFKEIWESTYTGRKIYPYGSIFQVVSRV